MTSAPASPWPTCTCQPCFSRPARYGWLGCGLRCGQGTAGARIAVRDKPLLPLPARCPSPQLAGLLLPAAGGVTPPSAPACPPARPPQLAGLFLLVAFGSCMDIAAIQSDCAQRLDFNRELGTIGGCGLGWVGRRVGGGAAGCWGTSWAALVGARGMGGGSMAEAGRRLAVGARAQPSLLPAGARRCRGSSWAPPVLGPRPPRRPVQPGQRRGGGGDHGQLHLQPDHLHRAGRGALAPERRRCARGLGRPGGEGAACSGAVPDSGAPRDGQRALGLAWPGPPCGAPLAHPPAPPPTHPPTPAVIAACELALFALPVSIVQYAPCFFFGSLLVRGGDRCQRVALRFPGLFRDRPGWAGRILAGQAPWRRRRSGPAPCPLPSLPLHSPTQVWFGVEIVLDWMVRSARKLSHAGALAPLPQDMWVWPPARASAAPAAPWLPAPRCSLAQLPRLLPTLATPQSTPCCGPPLPASLPPTWKRALRRAACWPRCGSPGDTRGCARRATGAACAQWAATSAAAADARLKS